MTKLLPVESVKWVLFRALEKLSYLRGNTVPASTNNPAMSHGQKALWVFVSTIGEVNAIKPFLNSVSESLKSLKLVLITDHEHYRVSYLEQYPDAVVYVTRDRSDDALQLARLLPPAMLIIAEIPCLPNDAPCRFSYSFMRTAKRYGASICLVNGWLYHYSPTCRMDAIERRWFQRDYARLFDMACVQTDDVRRTMIEVGASPDRLRVTGNIKFDCMQRTEWSPGQARSPILLNALLADGRPTVVAGCVSSYDEQQQIMDAFLYLLTMYPDALLVLAPRHPEYQERMDALKYFLSERGLRAQFRSHSEDAALVQDIQCLVLDTIGELKDFYAASSIAYVGCNHNILEPLAFGKPVVVSGGWEPTYPSYPVYQSMLEAGAVLQVDDANSLGKVWLSMIQDPAMLSKHGTEVKHALERAKGASERCLTAIMPLVMKAKAGT